MSDFLNIIRRAHASLDRRDPAVLILDGKTPTIGVQASSWPVDGTVADVAGLTFRPVAVRVSVLRTLLSSEPEIGDIAYLDAKKYTVAVVKSDSIAYELDLSDPRSL